MKLTESNHQGNAYTLVLKSVQKFSEWHGAEGRAKSEIRARRAGYFEELNRVDEPDREFLGDVDAVRNAEPPVSCDPPTLEETRRAVNQLKSGKALEGCGIYAEMLRAEEPPLSCG